MPLPDWRYIVKIRTRDVSRILNNITHPTELGASAMRLRANTCSVPSELMLLLEILKEECGADINLRGIIAGEHIDRVPRPVTERINPRDSQVCDTERLPLPPPTMVCEFDLGLTAKQQVAGRFLSVIFWMMIFNQEGIARLLPRRSNGQKTGSDSETSGVWGVAPGRERLAKEAARDTRPERRRAGGT